MQTLSLLVQEKEVNEKKLKGQEMEIESLKQNQFSEISTEELNKIPENLRNVAQSVVKNHHVVTPSLKRLR